MAAAAYCRTLGATRLYKKIDSTLRGHVRAEIHAALNGWEPESIAIVCPAFPEMGRTVLNGEVCVNGVPVSETALAKDPVNPVTDSRVPVLIGGAHVRHIAGESAQALADRIDASGPAVAVDAADAAELQRVAEAVVLMGSRAIAVGSAGLASHLARLWAVDTSALRRKSDPLDTEGTLTIVIVTSCQDLASQQAAVVSMAGATVFQPTAAELLDDHAWSQSSERAINQLNNGESILLLKAPTERRTDFSAALIPQRFADLAVRVIAGSEPNEKGHHARVSGVVVTGGDGARALTHALGATGLSIEGEVAIGIPLGRLVGGSAAGLRIVTKAGGFGAADALLQAVHAVRGEPAAAAHSQHPAGFAPADGAF
jgi:uncharacterized protein YgbK (DUF1537 family)